MKRLLLLATLVTLVLAWRARPQAVGFIPVDSADLRARENHARDVLALGEWIGQRVRRLRRIEDYYEAMQQ